MIVSNKDKQILKDMPADEIKALHNSRNVDKLDDAGWNAWFRDCDTRLDSNEIYREKPQSPQEMLESEKAEARLVISTLFNNYTENYVGSTNKNPIGSLRLAVMKALNDITIGADS